MLTHDEILTAANDYDEEVYPAELYRDRLVVLQNATSVLGELKNAISDLFHWKLGKATKFRTPTSYPLTYVSPEGLRYYGIKMTGANKSAIEAASHEDLLSEAIQFRDSKLPYLDFKKSVSRITKTSIVLPTFYLHIWKPSEHPIFDENVWKLYLHQMGKMVKRGTKPSSWKQYETYVPWFQNIVEETGLAPLIADRGLWVLGGDIKADVNRSRRNGRTTGSRSRATNSAVEKVVADYLALSDEDQEVFRVKTKLF